MQVSQLIELDTHAVIGGGEAQSFGMSDSAEFFTVLSDTLYRDKKRAVIRETVCNAWDAHIMMGKTDTCVEITLTDEELVIKDFGPGIAEDRIVPIYCVYGASTKVADENQTGGFGLGSKSPFAYSDHFTVMSCHEGIKNVYAISRGGSATLGKPDIRSMVKVPTKDSGITVSIPLKNVRDRHDFDRIIRLVARQGGMKVRLNGEELPTFDYTAARKRGYCVIQRDRYEFSESTVYLLYGTVLYPVSTTDQAVQHKLQQAEKVMPSSAVLVLVAPPNSVGVTPSREALSYSELTTNTIIKLVEKATRQVQAEMIPIRKKIIRRRLKKVHPYRLPNAVSNDTRSDQVPHGQVIDDPKMIAGIAIQQSSYYGADYYTARKLVTRLAIELYPERRKMLRRVLHGNVAHETEYFAHSSRLPLRLACKLNLLDSFYGASMNYYYSSRRVVKFDEIRRHGYIFDHLVIAPTQKDALKMADEIKKSFSHEDKVLFHEHSCFIPILIVRKPQEDIIPQIEALAKQYKLKTTTFDYSTIVKKARKVGNGIYFDLSKAKHGKVKGEPTLSEPRYYIRGSVNSYSDGVVVPMASHLISEVTKQYGNIAVITTTKQEAKLKARGVKNIFDVLMKELEGLIKRRDVQYAYLMQSGKILTDGYHYHSSVSHLVERLVRLDLRLAKLLFPERVKQTDKYDRAMFLIDLFCTSEVQQQGYEMPKRKLEMNVTLEKQAKETFAHLRLSSDDAKTRFGWLRVMCGSNLTSAFDSQSKEEALQQIEDTIRFLKRRFASKSDLNDNTINAHKEAA